MIVRAALPEHLPWIIQRCDLAVTPGFRAIEAVGPKGEILAMVGYDAWTLNAVQMHVAIDVPLVMAAREFVYAAFAYPFIQSKKGLVYTVTPDFNKKSLRLQTGLGFKREAEIRDGWADGCSLVVMVMRRNDCRWLRRKPVEA